MKNELHHHLTNVSTDDNAATATLSLPADFAGFQGHFPENPVLPGVCLVQAGVILAETAAGKELRMTALKRAKFLSPVGVDDPVELSCTLTDLKAKVSITRGEDRVAQFSLVLQEVDA